MSITPNAKQQQCINNINGKYLILAGPGTGKTFTITQRIKYMIEKGVEPDKILCLTFTTAAANEMKVRLEKELEDATCDVNIYTYHSLCNEIIENYAEDFDISDNFTVIPEPVSRAFVKECIEELKPQAYRNDRNNPYPYINKIINNIEEIKKYRLNKTEYFLNIKINPDWEPELQRLKDELAIKRLAGKTTKTLEGKIESQEKKIAKAKELWSFYELYTEKMRKNNYLDYNDMINMVLEKFENTPAFLDKIANQYEYLLVDEYQDTNKSQNEIVFHLTKALKSENVLVVGDDDQIIYSFQGAKLDTIENFLTTFPETKVICLTENMRSTQNILDISRKITEQDPNRLENNSKFKQYDIDKRLISKNEALKDKNIKVRCCKYNMTLQEYIEIVDEIVSLVNSDECPVDKNGDKKLSEIAILTRTNAELETFAEMLKVKGIPYEMKDGKSIFTIKASIVLFSYMQMLVNPELHSDKIFRLLLSRPFNINAKDYEILCKERSKYKVAIDAVINCDKSEMVEPEKVERFVETYKHLQNYRINETLKNTILEICAKTGIVEYYLNSDINRTENIAGLTKLIDEASGFAQVNKTITLEDFVQYLTVALDEDIEIKTEKAPVALNAIQLSTYYSAKGREFEYVYMPTLLRNKWECDNKSMKAQIPLGVDEYKDEKQQKAEKLSDRIKVMYVGMTRAKHTLRLSYVAQDNGKEKKVSELIQNILKYTKYTDETKEPNPIIQWFLDRFETKSYAAIPDDNAYWDEMAKGLVKKDYDYHSDFDELLNSIVLNKSFSASAINKYLNCPRQYFFQYILGLKTKDGNPDALSYGEAIHTALEFAIKDAKEKGVYPNIDTVIGKFEQKLNSLAMSSYEQRQIHLERGKKTLNEVYAKICYTPVSQLYKTEYDVNFEIDGIKFYGRVDRIDENSDGTLTIYDYKTGSAKKPKDICEGGEHEDYYNQIGLYKYFIEKATGKTVKETIFLFPEEYEGNYSLNLTDEDCEKIIDKFKQAINDIKDHKFEPATDKEACKYCPYKDFCVMQIV